MKKTVSFLLVITLLLSIVSVISPFALQDEDSAEDSEIITEIDFESSKQLKFYMNDDGTVREENVYTADAKGIREETIYSDVKSTVAWLRRPYSTVGNADNEPWASSMRLCDADGEALKLEAGNRVSLTADVKVNNKNSNIKNLYLGIVFTTQTCRSMATTRGSYDNSIKKYYNEGKLIPIANIGKASGWQRIGGIITVPEHSDDELPMLVFYSTENFNANSHNNAEMWLDEIIVSEYVEESGILTKIDFESKHQERFYTLSDGRDREENLYSANSSGIRKNEQIANNWTSNVVWLRRPYSTAGNADNDPWASSLKLCSSLGTNINFISGSKIAISSDVKANIKSTDIKNLYLGIVFTTQTCRSMATTRGSYNNSIKKYYDEGKLIPIVNIGKTRDWQRIGGIITVPEHSENELPMLVVYSTENFNANSYNNAEMWLDNIIVSEYTEESDILSETDFESDEQLKFYRNDNGTDREENLYSSNSKGIRENLTVYEGYASNAVWLRRPYSTAGNADNDPWASSMRLCDADGEALKLEAGNNVSFTADVKVNNKNSNIKNLYLGIVFTTQNCRSMATTRGSYNDSIKKYYEQGKLIQLADISAANSWKKVSGTVTVPDHNENELPMLVFYSTENFNANSYNNAEMWLDNIVVEKNIADNGVLTEIDFESDLQQRFYTMENGFDRETNIYSAGKGFGETDMGDGALSKTFYMRRPYSVMGNKESSPWASSIKLCSSYGTNINFKSGDKLKISLDLKPDASCSIKTYNIGILFTDQSCLDMAKTQGRYDKSIQKYYNDGKLIKIGGITKQHSRVERVDYRQTISGIITVPEHTENEYPMLVLYSEEEFDANSFGKAAIWLNKIVVENYDGEIPTAKSLITGFEADEYSGTAYTNKFDTLSAFIGGEVSDDEYNTKNTAWLTNSENDAYNGSGCLYINNAYDVYKKDSEKLNAIAVLNKDGSNYKLVSGVKYHLKYKLYYNYGYYPDEVVSFIVSDKMPQAGYADSEVAFQVAHNHGVDANFGEYGKRALPKAGVYNTIDTYFEATSTGNLYITFYTSGGNKHDIKIDDLSIIPETEENAVEIHYHEEDGTTCNINIGVPGNELAFVPVPAYKSGKTFNGWYKSDGTPFTQLTYPENNIDVYAKYVDVEDVPENTSIDWSKPITTDFENTDAVQKYYHSYNNVSTDFKFGSEILHDASLARSGSNAIGIMGMSFTRELKHNPIFRIYAENTLNNSILLDANSSYKLTYYIKWLEADNAANRLYTVGLSSYEISAYEATDRWYTYEEYLSSEPKGEFKKVEQIINVGPERRMLGFEFYGTGAVAVVDDITVEKLGRVYVDFETNGGSAVDSLDVRMYEKIDPPAAPVKEGYEFAGWYKDSNLKTPFDFDTDEIVNAVKLYAKWEKAVQEKAPDKKYKTVYDTEYREETVENEIKDAELDEALTIADNDVPAKNGNAGKSEPKQNSFPWWIIIIAVSVAGITAAVVIILLKKRRKAN